MRRSAAETSYREDIPWEYRGLCRDDPKEWDLDVIGVGTPEAYQAQQWCLTACPVLAECTTWTEELIGRGMPPQAVVQAGAVYLAAGWKATRRGRCKRGHVRTAKTVSSNGTCKKCAADRDRERKRRMRRSAVKEAS